MLTEQQCERIETGLTETVEPRKVAAYLCLHMGLTLAEAAGLRRGDIDLNGGRVVLRSYVGKPEGSGASDDVQLLPLEQVRSLPIPPHVFRYLSRHDDLYADGNAFMISGETTLPAFYTMQNLLTSINLKYKIAGTLSVSDLRNAFIRRCIQSGMDLYTLCAYIGIRQPNVILKRFREFFRPRLDEVRVLEKYSADYVPAPSSDPASVRQMNLLILGAGSQGPVVKEIAEAIGIFEEIAFLDDDPGNALAIGPLKDVEKLKARFSMATVSFGDSHLRERWMDRIDQCGYIVPTLIHPSATISPSAKIGRAAVIEARCIVSAGAAVGRGVILSGACVIETNVRIGQFVHIGSSATVTKGAAVEDYQRIPSGTVVRMP